MSITNRIFSFLNIVILALLLFALAINSGRLLKVILPAEVYGYLEGYYDKDLTSDFAISEIGGDGRCRIDNVKAAQEFRGEPVLVYGWVNTPERSYGHLWAFDSFTGETIDVTGAPRENRTIFAVVDLKTEEVLWQASDIREGVEKTNLEWGPRHLRGLKEGIEDRG